MVATASVWIAHENGQSGEKLFSMTLQNATQLCPFANQIFSWLAKYVYINDKDVKQVTT